MRPFFAVSLSLALLAAGAGQARGNYGFHRTVKPDLLPDDPRQWSGYARSTLITDLAGASPAEAVTSGRRRLGHWHVVPYATGEFKGRALAVFGDTDPPAVHVRLHATGWTAVYIGVGPAAWASRNTLGAKLSTSSAYRSVGNTMRPIAPRRDFVQEQFLALNRLDGSESVDFQAVYGEPAMAMYVRLVPVSDEEARAWAKDTAPNRKDRTSVATNDGFSPWIPAHASTSADLLRRFEGFPATDIGQWWFCPDGADLLNYPSRLGTMPGEKEEDFPNVQDGWYAQSIRALAKAGVNPMVVARESARSQGQSFHVLLRPAGFGAAIPTDELFASRFFAEHPEWRCVDREGHRTLYLSYAVPEVRRHILDVLVEAVRKAGPDGVGFFFNRAIPLMLWEKAFADRFASAYHTDLQSVPAEDPRIYRLRGQIMDEYLREIRAALDRIRPPGKKRLQISAITFTTKAFNDRYGLDVETWVREGLIDQIGIDEPTWYDPDHHSPDIAYYRRITAGHAVRLYPMVIAWDSMRWVPDRTPAGLCRLILSWYAQGADGVLVWDAYQGRGFNEGAPSVSGDTIDLLGYLGHRELIAAWAEHGMPLPHAYPLVRLGENEYSPWVPNRGY